MTVPYFGDAEFIHMMNISNKACRKAAKQVMPRTATHALPVLQSSTLAGGAAEVIVAIEGHIKGSMLTI